MQHHHYTTLIGSYWLILLIGIVWLGLLLYFAPKIFRYMDKLDSRKKRSINDNSDENKKN